MRRYSGSDNPKKILLSPLGGGEDGGERVKCGAHPLTPIPSQWREGAKKGSSRTGCEAGFRARWAK
ncbi:MAG: hypothetical protein H6Q51_1842 [Deltaproteobacteria bacterium]|nr:hypothetical protein [Deltaproteobacteria bacterium]